eukprot:SAG11_NODE_25542_length_357_cov_1.007752_1_plen_39_part_01
MLQLDVIYEDTRVKRERERARERQRDTETQRRRDDVIAV